VTLFRERGGEAMGDALDSTSDVRGLLDERTRLLLIVHAASGAEKAPAPFGESKK
jgi:hypothetical protein